MNKMQLGHMRETMHLISEGLSWTITRKRTTLDSVVEGKGADLRHAETAGGTIVGDKSVEAQETSVNVTEDVTGYHYTTMVGKQNAEGHLLVKGRLPKADIQIQCCL